MTENQNSGSQSRNGTVLRLNKRKEFLDECEKTVSKVFKDMQTEETKAYNKQKGFVIRWT